MQMWMIGLALAAVLAVAAWDVGRPGRASGPGLTCLRAIGGSGLAAMALLALRSGHAEAALVAAAGAAPLVAGLVRRRPAPGLARPARVAAALPRVVETAPGGHQGVERRAA